MTRPHPEKADPSINAGEEPRLSLLQRLHAEQGQSPWLDDLTRDVGFRPSTSIEDGIDRFVSWYTSYYGNGGPS